MKKVLIIFGTRPEAIKLAPVIKKLKEENIFETIICSTGQHREMLKQVLDIFSLDIDRDLDLMKPDQDLFDITVNSLSQLKNVFAEIMPDLVVVQGDTTTAFASALAAFYFKIPVAHIEAGLRSYNIFSPYPEEANRRFISVLTEMNFAPTGESADNLLREGFPKENIFTTGNTVIDALFAIKKTFDNSGVTEQIEKYFNQKIGTEILDNKFILITMHRREKFGAEFRSVLETIKEIADEKPGYNFIYPVHLNPNVKKPVEELLGGADNIILLEPLDYLKFIYLMSKCNFIMSDSGGIQEECYVFKKPIIVLRDVTERNEAVKAGYAFLVGSDKEQIKYYFNTIDDNLKTNFNYFTSENPFGDGNAAGKILGIIKEKLNC